MSNVGQIAVAGKKKNVVFVNIQEFRAFDEAQPVNDPAKASILASSLTRNIIGIDGFVTRS